MSPPFAHMLHTPRVRLHTPRVRLSAPRAQDAAAQTEAITESLPALRAWSAALPWAQDAPSLAASQAFVRSSLLEWQRGTALVYLVWEQGTQHLLGSVGLHALDWQTRHGELGFWCRSSRTGQGLMREATAELLSHAQQDLGLQRIEALTDADNLRSCALCERLGMQRVRDMQHAAEGDEGKTSRSIRVYAAVAG